MQTAINAGFGVPLIDRDFADIDSWGFLRVRTDVQPEYDNRAILSAFRDQAASPLVILGPTSGPEQLTDPDAWVALALNVASLAEELGVEIDVNDGNEPNLSDYWKHRPELWAEKCVKVYEALRKGGFEGAIYAGCESNLGAAHYTQAMGWRNLPADLIPDIHWYSDHADFFHRPHWGQTLQECFWHNFEACGERNFAVSEFGLSSAGADDATFDAICAGVPRDEWIGAQLALVLDFLEAHSTPLAGVFQINDGPAADHESHYGLRMVDSWAWKSQAFHLQCWHHRN